MSDIKMYDTDDKREYSRVDVYIPIEYRLVNPLRRDTLRSRIAGESILAEFKNLPNPDDQLIAQWLQSINAKLDEIIRMMTLQHDGFDHLNIAKVNISGGGMSLNTGESFSPGDVLEIKAMLGLKTPTALFLYGEVIEVTIHHDEYDTSVQFVNIDDFVRDEIIRFVFETEREILREKRR
ncbi:MAG: PilZ domain-containing protein [Deltaproteobacteria bacterium]